MNDAFNKNSILSLIFMPIVIFYLEMVYKLFALKNGLDISIIYTLLISMSLGLIINLVLSFFKPKVSRIISILLCFLISFTVCVQYVYYIMFYTPMVLYSVKGAGQVLEFTDMIIEAIFTHLYVVILLLLPLVAIIILSKKNLLSYNFSIKKRIITILSYVVLKVIVLSVLLINGTECDTDFDIYYNTNVPNLVVNRFGIIPTIKKDMCSLVFNSFDTAGNDKYYNEKTADDKNSGTIIKPSTPGNNDSNLENSSDNEVVDDVKKVERVPNVLNIDFDKLIEEEKNESIKSMHEYFKNTAPTYTNEYTGMFEGYNLIFITAESFSHLAVDKELTPTLYKMANEGFVFNNFYNPVWGVSTSDGEYVACQSLIPKSGVWSFFESGSNYLPFTMGHQFSKLGYKTRAYHNHYFDFYRRDVSHPNMGYEYKGLGNGLDVRETWPESDLEMMELTIPEYINDESFHTYYMTVSGHKNYTFYGNYMAGKNKEYVENLDYSEPVRAYLACNIELEKAMEYLLDKLREKGIAKKTAIVISADHYPYGLEKSEIDERAGHVVEENFELYKSCFIVYVDGMEPVVIDKECSSLDIVPTISNLFGLEYDSRLYMGRDILSDSDPLVIFANRSFITDKVMYNSITRDVTYLTDEKVDENYLKEIKQIVANKFLISQDILDRNYYSYIVKKD